MYIRVTVTANAKKETLAVAGENHFKISVKEKAARNMANNRIREIFARHFKVPIGKVRIISGYHSPVKLLAIG
ncbi:MAG: DUF167 domain-containing protein [bacterium]|nr:DUF167 domain-containing protein [bacterium]